MDKRDRLKEEDKVSQFTLDDEEMILLLKGLDLYGYSLIMSESKEELFRVKCMALKLIAQMPKPELNS